MACEEKVKFFEKMDDQELALTFDDVRMRTRSGRQNPLPDVIDITSRFSEHVELTVPFVSAAMDTVTTGDMAIAMAKIGGLGVIHAAMPPEQQHDELRRVKKEINGLIENPICVDETATLEAVRNMRERRRFSFGTFPVLNSDKRLVGILSGDDFDYPDPDSLSTTVVSEVMKPVAEVTSASVDTDLPQAYRLMQSKKVRTLPLLHRDGTLGGLFVFSDVSRIFRQAGQYNIDSNGQLRTAAAVSTGTKDVLERIEAIYKYLDVAVIDTADGDSYYLFKTLEAIKEAYPQLDVVVGNISDGASARELAEAGANGIKVGQGPGSICTTRRETGIGMPQVTAVYDCVRALGEKFAHIPVCADGGIKDHGDIPIAFAAGARSVMMGRMLAGTQEAPGEVLTRRDGNRVKIYRGMGSASALQENAASRERYGATGTGLFLAEGVEAQVPFVGRVENVMEYCTFALRKAMRYVKAPDLESHRENTLLRRITGAGLRESHPHDIEVIKQ